MLLVSEQDFEEMQKSALEAFYNDFLEKLDTSIPNEDDYQAPRAFIMEIVKEVLIGHQEYNRMYSIVENILLNRKSLKYFGKVHTKQEVLDFILENN